MCVFVCQREGGREGGGVEGASVSKKRQYSQRHVLQSWPELEYHILNTHTEYTPRECEQQHKLYVNKRE